MPPKSKKTVGAADKNNVKLSENGNNIPDITESNTAKPQANRKKSRANAGAASAKPTDSSKNIGKSSEKSGADAAKTGKNTGDVSIKTPQVMKLIAADKRGNPVIAAGKSRMPTRLKGKAPLSQLLKQQARSLEDTPPEEIEVVNLTELAVQYEAPQILDKFNACSCEKCVAVFSQIILKKVSARFARISRSENGIRSQELDGRVDAVRRVVRDAMIRELIGSRKRMFHDE